MKRRGCLILSCLLFGLTVCGCEICVVGTFDTYVEGEYTYCTLRDARLV